MPRRDRDAVAADERDTLAPGDAHVGAVVDTRKRPELSAGADVPDAHGAIGAERREACAVRAEPGREDAAAMRAQRTRTDRRWRHSRALRCRRRLLSRRASRPGCTRPRGCLLVCPASVASVLPVCASRMLAVLPEVGCDEAGSVGRDGDDVADPSCLRLRPMLGPPTARARCRARRAGPARPPMSMVPSCRRVVSAASIASRMLRSGSTARFACAEAASWRAVARRASSRACPRNTSANTAMHRRRGGEQSRTRPASPGVSASAAVPTRQWRHAPRRGTRARRR